MSITADRSSPSRALFRVTSPAPRDLWQEILAADPWSLESQSPAWAEAAAATGGLADASRLYELPGGRRLVVPMLRRRHFAGRLGIEGANPHGWGVGGILAPGGVSCADFDVVLGDLAQRTPLLQTMWPNPLEPDGRPLHAPAGTVVSARVAHAVDLAGGFGRVWSGVCTPSSRRGARHAERAGVTIECSTTGGLLPEFTGLLEQAVQRWARRQHEPPWMAAWRHRRRDPPEKFEAIAGSLGAGCRVWVARVEGRPAAAMMVLTGNNAYDFRAAMDEELTSYRANDLLLRHSLEQACADGCRYYYMGDSGHSASLASFKERFGARPFRYAEYRFERAPLHAVEQAAKRTVKHLVKFREG